LLEPEALTGGKALGFIREDEDAPGLQNSFLDQVSGVFSFTISSSR
jgi:hypothetical protein